MSIGVAADIDSTLARYLGNAIQVSFSGSRMSLAPLCGCQKFYFDFQAYAAGFAHACNELFEKI
jgi:hypothetical protein